MTKKTITNGVRKHCLESWEEFADLVKTDFLPGPAYVFRGQTDYSWPLESSLDRLENKYRQRKTIGRKPHDCHPLSRENHLEAFKRAARGRRGINPLPIDDDDEWWALAQHHGLATPLLDWTRSPFVALFFAFETERRIDSEGKNSEPSHRGVYALSSHIIKEEKKKENQPFFFSPEGEPNHRLINQNGLLLCMPEQMALEPYIRNKFAEKERQTILIKIKIKNVDRNGCLATLNKMNINYMNLFPDLDGAARHVNSLWEEGRDDSLPYV